MKRYLLLIVLLLACALTPLDDNTAALVNGEPISKEELLNNMHFMTLHARNLRGRELAEAHLDLLIDKKLFAQEGKKRGLAENPVVRQVTDWAERDQMVKTLYRDEVRTKVLPTEEQVRAAFFRGREQLRLRHLFARSEAEALHLKEQLDAGSTFEELAARTFRDSTLRRSGGDLGFVGYEDIDEKLADVAFELPQHQVSPPVRSRYGWHLLRVDNRRQQLFNSEADYAREREAIAKELRRSQEKKLAGAYVEQLMTPLDVKMTNAAFNILAANVQSIVLGAARMVPNYQPMLGGAEMAMMNRGLGGHEQDILVAWKGGEWTLGEFMKRVEALPITERPRLDTPGHLRFDIGKMVMRELLAREAKRKQLDKDPVVREAVRKWQEEYIFGALWQNVRDTVQLNRQEEETFFAAHQGRYREYLQLRPRGALAPDSLQADPRLQRQVQEDARDEKMDQTYARMAAELRQDANIRRNEKVLQELAKEFPATGERIDVMGVPNK